MTTSLSENSFIDLSYYNLMSGSEIEEGSEDEDKFINICNSIVNLMESFCGRPLKSRRFSYIQTDYNYDPENSIILDPPRGSIFYFPTYPVSSIEEFNVDDIAVTPATTFAGNDGYIFFPKQGKMVYYSGFGSYITTIYTAGYDPEFHPEQYADLQYLSYLFVSEMWSLSPGSTLLASEKIGNYSYSSFKTDELAKTMGISPSIFYKLGKYKRYFIE